MVGLLHAMAFMVLLLIGWVIWNNKPLPLPFRSYGVPVLFSECHEWSPLACAVGHAATFAVNAAVVASQWQHRALTVPLTHLQRPSTRLDRRQVSFCTSSVSIVFGIVFMTVLVSFFKSSSWPNREWNQPPTSGDACSPTYTMLSQWF